MKDPKNVERMLGDNNPAKREDVRKKISESKVGKVSGENNPMYGKHHSDETKQKISDAQWMKQPDYTPEKHPMYGRNRSGSLNPMYGRKQSEETKKLISKIHKGKTISEEHRRRLSIARKGKKLGPRSEETRRKISEGVLRNLEDHPEIREKLSQASMGNTPWNKGLTKETDERLKSIGESIKRSKEDIPAWNKKLTKESDDRVRKNAENISKALMGHSVSEETKLKMSESLQGRVISEEHRKRLSEANFGENNPMKRPDVKEKHLMACRDPERCKKISDVMKLNNPMYDVETVIKSLSHHTTNYNGGYVQSSDGTNVYLRSSYEIRVAELLNKYNIEWKYELPIQLNRGHYFPDFYIPTYDIWIEVKGWDKPDDILKMRECYELYPDMNIRMVYLEHIINAEDEAFDMENFGIPLSEQIEVWNEKG